MLLLVSSFAKNFVIFTRPVWEMYVICRRSLCQNGIKFYSNCILWILIGSGSSSCSDRSNVGIGRWTLRMFDKVLSIENRCYHQIVFLPQNKYRVYNIYGSEIIQASNRHACDLMHPKKAHCSRIEIIISSSIPIFFSTVHLEFPPRWTYEYTLYSSIALHKTQNRTTTKKNHNVILS